jgi:general secretion pathway protein D
MSDLTSYPLRALTLACIAVITGCAVQQPRVPAALDFPRTGDTRSTGDFGDPRASGPTETVVRQSPIAPAPITGNLRPISAKATPDERAGDLSVNFEQMALPVFIQAVYGGILKVNYSIDPAVTTRTELITFRTPKPLTAAKLSEVSAQLLRSYGVAVQDFGGVLRMVPDSNTNSTLPLVRRGRAQPSVPLPLRPIFHYVETEAVRPGNFLPTLKSILGSKVTLEVDSAGGMLLSGQPDDVSVALELIQVFDQPSLRAQNTTRVVPRFWGADEFSRRLSDILRAEGYGVGNQPNSGEPISILSVSPVNSVLIFSSSKEVLAHILDWVQELDQLPTVQAGSAYFTYSVRHADAQELAKSLNDLISGVSTTSAAPSAAGGAGGPLGTGTPGATPAAPASTAARGGRRVVVNNATNSLIFQGGSQEDYRQWLTLLSQLDKPVKSAMIDVLVAEVALDDVNSFGFEWKLSKLGSGAQAVRLSGTTYGLQADGKGLVLDALLGGNPFRSLVINALASNVDTRVVSNPKLVTRNGESATITVGDEVPIVTSQGVTQSSGTFSSTTNVIPQNVQYRSTGVILRVRPVIHAGDRIDIEISQEVSRAIPTDTGVISSPTIRKRSVETKLSMRDGATVMLAGLISENNDDSNSGVPGLKDVPFFGSLFRNQKKSRGRTELVILITPYILNDTSDAEAATDAFNNSLGQWADGVRDRVNAARSARKLRSDQEGVAPSPMPEPAATEPKPVPIVPRIENATPPPGKPGAAAPRLPSTVTIQPRSSGAEQAPRMINLGNAAGTSEPGSSAAPGGANALPGSNPAGTGLPSAQPGSTGLPAGRKAPPASINGQPTLPGTTEVDDPKLLKELLDLTRKR